MLFSVTTLSRDRTILTSRKRIKKNKFSFFFRIIGKYTYYTARFYLLKSISPRIVNVIRSIVKNDTVFCSHRVYIINNMYGYGHLLVQFENGIKKFNARRVALLCRSGNILFLFAFLPYEYTEYCTRFRDRNVFIMSGKLALV